ncbi:MAG TPA: HWE histidine kinase domain-containing protein [Steroidobacteraceae bacterium]|nr:HWE histidine kinase domain-containing protein [Steroidobacteraceae bacterium]
MMATREAALDPERYLAAVLDELTAAPSREEALRIATQAAHDLAGCDGLYLLREVKDGEREEAGHTLVVPLHDASGHAAVGFFWQPWRTVDQQSTSKLEALAKMLGLAARMWRGDEEHMRQLRDERHAAADLQHRLRNQLALMRSVVRRSHETAESPEEFALHLDGRIGALTRTQGMLMAAGSAGVDLEGLIRTELLATTVSEQRYRVAGPVVRLRPKAAESLGLAFHELATNSLKFGALASETGLLAVTWALSGQPQPELHLTWVESGITIASLAPRRRGFGQELIESTLPYELDARTRFALTPGGAYCTMVMPVHTCAIGFDQPPQQAAGAGSQ